MVLEIPKWIQFYTDTGSVPCCFTCANFDNPVCTLYGKEPPAEFAEKPGSCDKWLDKIPF